MCTAISYHTSDHYFGRNLDLEYSYCENITITPRQYPFKFRKVNNMNTHYAMIGMAYVVENYPLYYDATNEKGLSMAGLSFEGNACYYPETAEKWNVTPFELIPFLLGQCGNVSEAEEILTEVNIFGEAFSEELPLSPLHWMVSDKDRSIVVETLSDGMRIYPNPIGVLTNNPQFSFQMIHLTNYMGLSREMPVNRFSQNLCLEPYSRGMGAMGLPGDLSSGSRFVKAAFTKENSICGTGEEESVSQFFHILGSVEQQRGCVYMGDGKYEITIYSSCCNTDKGIYYYRTYDNSQITAVEMFNENLEGSEIIQYPMVRGQQIKWQNGYK